MPELRWALLALGLLFLAGLALWELRRSRHDRGAGRNDEAANDAPAVRLRRVEPSIEEFAGSAADDANMSLELPAIRAVSMPVRLEVAAEPAVDIPSAARLHATESVLPLEMPSADKIAIRWPPPRTDRVLSLRIVRANGESLQGGALRFALEAAGMRFGPQQIFHRTSAEGAVLASVANLVRPGSFDLAAMDRQEFRGLSLFSVLPGPLPDGQLLEELVLVSRRIAGRLGAEVQDEQGVLLDAKRLETLRQSLHADLPAQGDEAAP